MDAVRIVYLPANDAYMVTWHESRLAGPMPLDEALAWYRVTYGREYVAV